MLGDELVWCGSRWNEARTCRWCVASYGSIESCIASLPTVLLSFPRCLSPIMVDPQHDAASLVGSFDANSKERSCLRPLLQEPQAQAGEFRSIMPV